MKANEHYKNLDPEFWANVKLINQKIGYVRRKSKKFPSGGFTVPTPEEIVLKFTQNKLNSSKLVKENRLTVYGQKVAEYMRFRGDLLTNQIEPQLMDQPEAKKIFYDLKKSLKPSCPLPMNKQKGEKKDFAFLTGIVNMLIEKEIGSETCDYDPRLLTTITENNFPKRSMSRRVDGAFPSAIDPKAIWEIKEYYYTTTFGSRVADGVYETQLDGWELLELKNNLQVEIGHYLIVDSHLTWWTMGRSYLCRLVDSVHMGLVDEVLFGKEVLTRIPELAKQWVKKNNDEQLQFRFAAEPKEKYDEKKEENG